MRYFAFGAALLLGGCMSLHVPMTRFALDYNRMVAESRDSMLLLNIVRASNREPLHFSAVSQIEATLSVGGGIGGSAAFGGHGAPDNYGASVNLSGSYAPTFTVVPLNTSDFATGVLRPVTPEVIRLVRSQGWRDELLALLLIGKIECGNKAIRNDASADSVRDFSSIRFVEVPGANRKPDVPGKAIAATDSAQFEPPLDGHFVLPVDGSKAAALLAGNLDLSFKITQSGIAGGRALLSLARIPPDALAVELPPRLASQCASPPLAAIAGPTRGPGATVYLRSTQGAIYHLGELLRYNIDTTITLADNAGEGEGKRVTLFAVRREASPVDIVRVTHRGLIYAIRPDPAIALTRQPGATSDQTSEVLALIDQLIALQTSPATLERAPSTVRVR